MLKWEKDKKMKCKIEKKTFKSYKAARKWYEREKNDTRTILKKL